MRSNILIAERDVIKTYSKKQQELALQFIKVVELRKKTGWSKYKIADHLKFPISRIKHWIYDRTVPFSIKTIEKLKNKGLLPFSTENINFTLILDCFAFVYGDGYLNRSRVGFSSKNKNELIILKKNLEKIGFSGKIEEITTKNWMMPDGKILNGKCYTLSISSAALNRLLIALGAPVGNKTIKPFYLPDWLLNSNKEIKRRFLGVFYGNEGSAPTLNGKFINSKLRFKLVKDVNLKVEHEILLNQIKTLFEELGIETSKIHWEKSFNVRKDGHVTQPAYFDILPKFENFLRFYLTIPVLYNEEKKNKVQVIANKILNKFKRYTKRWDSYEEMISMLKKGKNLHQISLELNVNYKTLQYWKNGGKPVLYRERHRIKKLFKKIEGLSLKIIQSQLPKK